MSNKNKTIKGDRDRPRISTADAIGILIIVFVLIFAGLFTWSGYNHMHSKEIDARLLDTVPDEFVIVTGEELKEYPELEEAIITQSNVETDPDEWLETLEFLKEKGSCVVKFEGEYYEIGFVTA